MEFLNKLVRYFVRQLVALGLMAVAPAIYLVIPFLVLSTSSRGDLRDLAGVYLLTGPFVSAFWTMMILMVRRYKRMTAIRLPSSVTKRTKPSGAPAKSFTRPATATAIWSPSIRPTPVS